MKTIEQLTEQCYQMKRKALEMALNTSGIGCHIGGAFSAMEILTALYEVSNIKDMYSADRDRIILSKGHAVLAYYTVLWQNGFLADKDLATFNINGTQLHCHPHRDLKLGMEFSSGSLGLGLSYAVGVAIACKKQNRSNRIFVVLGDGECDEGIVWESLMSIANFGLTNMTLIVDKNKYQLDGPTTEVMNQFSLEDKLSAFGFHVTEVNGHDIETLLTVLQPKDVLNVVVADTIKAHGISFLENNKMSHYTVLTQKKYKQAIEELDAAYGKL